MAENLNSFKEKNGRNDFHVDIFCEDHPDEELETYCRDHELVLCSKCVIEQHSSCVGLESMSSAFNGKPKKEFLKRFDKDVSDMRQRLLKRKKHCEDGMKRLKEETDKAEKDVEDFRSLINWALDRMERKGRAHIQKRYNTLNKMLVEEVSRCEEFISRLDNFKDQRKVKGDGLSVDQYVKITKGRQVIAKSQKFFDKVKNTDCRDIVKFTVDPKVERFARNLAWFGKDRTYLSFEPPLTFPHLYQVKEQNQFDIKMKGDKHVCSIVDMCQVGDGTMLLADVSNCRLKQLDVLYRLVDSLTLPGAPRAVCSVDKEMAAVALDQDTSSMVQVVCLKNRLYVQDSFLMTKQCSGLGFIDGLFYILSDGEIYIYTAKGEESNVINIGITVRHFSISQDCKTIFMVTNTGLAVTDKCGEIIKELECESVKDANSVTLDTNSQLLVSHGDLHSVIQYNHDLQALGTVVCPSSGFRNPQALVFDRLHCRLIVAMKNKNVVKVFDLK